MIKVEKLVVVAAVALVLGLSALGEQIPAGTYTNSFSGTASVYDLSGTYQQSVGSISYSWTCNMDEKGKLTGQGTGTATADTEYGKTYYKIDATYNGAVKSAKNVTRVSYTAKEKGTVVASDLNAVFSGRFKFNAEIDSASGEMIGTVSGSMTISGQGIKRQTVRIPVTSFQLDLPVGETGIWNVTLNLAPAGKKYSGTATALAARGKSYPLTVQGSYNSKSDTSKLKIKGGKAMTLALVVGFQNAQIQFQGLKGKALGQKLYAP